MGWIPPTPFARSIIKYDAQIDGLQYQQLGGSQCARKNLVIYFICEVLIFVPIADPK